MEKINKSGLLHLLSIMGQNTNNITIKEIKKTTKEIYEKMKNQSLNLLKNSLTEQENHFINSMELNEVKTQNKLIPNFIMSAQNDLLKLLIEKKNSIVSAPTSFGKSKIIIDYIKYYGNENKHLIICPTLALNSEYFIKMKKENIICSTSPIYDEKVNAYILTPEKALIMLESKKNKMKFKTMIFDEFYEAFDKSLRHINFYDTFKEYSKFSEKTIVLMPSDVELPKDVIGNDFEKILIKKRATARFQTSYVLGKGIDGNSYSVYRKFDGFYEDEGLGFFIKEIEYKNDGDNFEKKPNQIHLDAILKIIKNKLIYHPKLKHMIFVKFPGDMPFLCKIIRNELINMKDIELEKTFWLKEVINYVKKNMDETELLESLKKGIAYHNGKMDKFVRWLIENAYKANEIKILISNTTLAKGINLSPNCLYMLYISSSSDPLKAIERQNAIGRVGRLMSNNIGEVYWFFSQSESYKKKIVRKTTSEEKMKIEMPNEEIPQKIDKMEKLYAKVRNLYRKKEIRLSDNLKSLLKKFIEGINYEKNRLILENLFDEILTAMNASFSSSQVILFKMYFLFNYTKFGYSNIYKNDLKSNVKINYQGEIDKKNGQHIRSVERFIRDRRLFKIM